MEYEQAVGLRGCVAVWEKDGSSCKIIKASCALRVSQWCLGVWFRAWSNMTHPQCFEGGWCGNEQAVGLRVCVAVWEEDGCS